MKARVILLSFLLCNISFLLHAKDRFVMAQIIMTNNDTLVNPILYDNLFDFQKKIVMRTDEGKLQSVFPNDAKDFYVIAGKKDTLHFESVCGLKFSLTDNSDANCFFLMKKCGGKYPVYYFAQSKMVSAGYTMQSANSASYVTKNKEEWVLFEEDNYVNQLLKFLKPLKRNKSIEVTKKISKLEDDLYYRTYRFDDIPSVFIRLNDLLK